MKRLPLLVLLATLALAASACDVGPTAATVNGVAISQSALNSDLAVLAGDHPGQLSDAACMLELQGSNVPVPANGAGDGTVTQELAAYQLSNMILGELIHQRLGELHHPVTHVDVAEARADLLTQLTPSSTQSPCGLSGAQLEAKVPSGFFEQQTLYLAEQEQLAAVLGGVDLSTAGLKDYYDAHPQDFQLVCLSDIAVTTQAEATQIRASITAGTTSFAAAAAQSSIDTQTNQQGGQIGCVPIGQIQNQVILSALDGVAVGGITQPVEQPPTQAGGTSAWLLLMVDAKTVTPFSQAESQIRQTLLAAHNSEVTTEFSRITDTSEVVVNPQYGSWSKLSGIVESPTPPPARDVPVPSVNLGGAAAAPASGSASSAGG